MNARISPLRALSPGRQAERFRARPRKERRALLVLASLLALGIVLRAWLWFTVRPAFIGYVDSQAYIGIASDIVNGSPFINTSFPHGYPWFLVALNALTDQPALVPLVQHALGVASALLLYAAVRQVGAPVWAAVIPAGLMLLLGIQAFIGQAILSESLFNFLVAVVLYGAVRSLGSSNLMWPATTGLLVGLAPIVRFAGIVIVPIIIAWFLLAGRSRWQRLAFAGVAALGAVLVIGAYTVYVNEGSGQTTAGTTSWPLYARVAGFADCREFTPPPGTRALCDPTPPSERTQGGNDYLFSTVTSPALAAQAAGKATPEDVKRFTIAVLLNQPLDYLSAIAVDQVRWLDPTFPGTGNGQEWEGFMAQLVDGADATAATGSGGADIDFRPFYPEPGFYKGSALTPLRIWERVTRIEGPLAVALFGLALAGLFLSPPGRTRAGAALFCLATAALAVGPASLLVWQARYGIPVAVPLAAATGVGAWVVAERFSRRLPPPYTAVLPDSAGEEHKSVPWPEAQVRRFMPPPRATLTARWRFYRRDRP